MGERGIRNVPMGLFDNQNIAKAGAFGGGISGLGGMFGSPEEPYDRARERLEEHLPEAKSYMEPFSQAGQGAIAPFQEYISRFKDPKAFLDQTMSDYHQSPMAQNQMQSMLRSAKNMGAARGLTGSTPLTQFAEQQAGKISSNDMQQYLKNILGIGSQYGQGMESLMGHGMQAGNALSQLVSNFAGQQAGLDYGSAAAKQGQQGNLFGGLGNLAMFAML